MRASILLLCLGIMSMQVSAKTIIYKKNISKSSSIIKTISDKEIQCMAETVYSEARGESLEGQLAVGHTILTRSKKIFNKPVCNVTKQQYTQRSIPKKDKEEFHHLAKQILFGATKNPIGEMDSFDSFKGRYSKRPKHTIKVGGHYFYKVLKGNAA
jgi:N-acetylmuramoyl-L-alanine amidase